MLHLANSTLRVDLLDPADTTDATRLGARFCHGGFIWQIHDLSHGSPLPLLSGPEYPSPAPTPFNAQGLPESFRHRTRDGTALTWNSTGTHGLAIGAGTVTADASGNVTLTEPCRWAITSAADLLLFHTRHSAAGFACELTRKIELRDRTVISSSHLTNVGETPLALEWFAHPFWPLTQHRARISLPAGTTFAENPGFILAADGTLTFRRDFTASDDSQFSLLTLPPPPPPVSPSTVPFAFSLDHPTLARVTFATSFAPDDCPVWANAHTVSVEPYLALRLAPGESREWHIRHGFLKT